MIEQKQDAKQHNAESPAHLADSAATAQGAVAAASGKLSYTIESYETLEDIPFDAANALLLEHAKVMHGRMVDGGGPDFDHALHIETFWKKIDTCLPPRGRFYLAWAPDGQLVGTGSLRGVSRTLGELKHLFVRPQARRAGLGRALVEKRIRDARDMGLRTLQADTFVMNWEMPALYDALGFERVPPFDTSAAVGVSPELLNHMLFFRYQL